MLSMTEAFCTSRAKYICTSHVLPPVVLADALGAPENWKAFIFQKLFYSQLKSLQIGLRAYKLFN